ncbi:MAG: hypothetical protein AB9888_15245 [Bacteroidales bacterium]
MNFSRRGQHNEIFPPPLIEGTDEVSLLQELVELRHDAIAPNDPIYTSKEALNLAIALHHQKRLREAIGGNYQTETEKAIFEAVERGERISLRPLGTEQTLVILPFAPVFQKIGEGVYRAGIEGQGMNRDFIGDPLAAFADAQRFYASAAAG